MAMLEDLYADQQIYFYNNGTEGKGKTSLSSPLIYNWPFQGIVVLKCSLVLYFFLLNNYVT